MSSSSDEEDEKLIAAEPEVEEQPEEVVGLPSFLYP